MDTPGVQQFANFTGATLKPAPFVLDVETPAVTLVRLVERPRDEVTVGLLAKLAKLEYALAPRLTEWALARGMEAYFALGEESGPYEGNLYRPMQKVARPSGGWRRPRGRLGGICVGALAAGAGLGAAVAFARRAR